MKVMRDETFGPVIGVMKVRDAEAALRLANDSRYGLSGSVFGERSRAERLARRVECGAVNVNDVLVNYAATDVPMGGWKQSGIGYRHGEPGIEPTWFPYTHSRRGLISRVARAFNARDSNAASVSEAEVAAPDIRAATYAQPLHTSGVPRKALLYPVM